MFWFNVGLHFKHFGYNLADLFSSIGSAIVEFFKNVIGFIRHVLFIVLSILYKLGIIVFIGSFHFIYKCVMEYNEGTAIKDMINLPNALYLFFIPIGITVLRDIVNPYKRQR